MISDIEKAADIKRLLVRFYDVAAHDDLIGPIFAELANSELHRQDLYHYWGAVLLDKQDSGQGLTDEERVEAEGLVDLADTLTYLGLKARPA